MATRFLPDLNTHICVTLTINYNSTNILHKTNNLFGALFDYDMYLIINQLLGNWYDIYDLRFVHKQYIITFCTSRRSKRRTQKSIYVNTKILTQFCIQFYKQMTHSNCQINIPVPWE